MPSRRNLIDCLLLNNRVIGFHHDRRMRSVAIDFECDRYIRGVAQAPPVRIIVQGVRALAYTVDLPHDVRPSRAGRLPCFTREELEESSISLGMSSCSYDTDREGLHEHADYIVQRLLVGTIRAYRAAPLRMWLTLHDYKTSRGHAADVAFLIGGRSMRIESDGRRLSMTTWGRQNDAWARRQEPDIPSKANLEKYRKLRAAARRRLRHWVYCPPPEPVWFVSPSKVPPAIIKPIRAWFEAVFARDWVASARVQRLPPLTLRAQAARLKYRSYDGRPHAREIGRWWVEGDRAFVTVFGVEYDRPCIYSLEENVANVWTFGLARRGSVWTITGRSGGLAKFCDTLPRGIATWLQDWPDLAPLTDPALVVQACAEAMGVREEGGRPLLELLQIAGLFALHLHVENLDAVEAQAGGLVDALFDREF